ERGDGLGKPAYFHALDARTVDHNGHLDDGILGEVFDVEPRVGDVGGELSLVFVQLDAADDGDGELGRGRRHLGGERGPPFGHLVDGARPFDGTTLVSRFAGDTGDAAHTPSM